MKRGRAGSFASLKKLRSSLTDEMINNELDEIVQSQEGSSKEFSFWSLFTDPRLRKPLLIASLFQLTQQWCGINAVFFYSTSIFDLTNPAIASDLSVGVGALTVLVTIVAAFSVDKAGRKILSLIGIAGMCATAVLYTVAFRYGIDDLALACTFIYVVFFSFSMGPIPFVILPEIFPTQGLRLLRCLSPFFDRGTHFSFILKCSVYIKTKAVASASSVAMVVNWISGFAFGQVFPLMSSGMGPYAFLVFAGFLVFSFFIILVFVPETKGKTLAQIMRDMKLE